MSPWATSPTTSATFGDTFITADTHRILCNRISIRLKNTSAAKSAEVSVAHSREQARYHSYVNVPTIVLAAPK
jgi:hypothetical protein